MIPIIDNPAILARYAALKPQSAAPEVEQRATEPSPQYARAPASTNNAPVQGVRNDRPAGR